MKKFFKEFKAFITKGNVFDMAVGLIIATAIIVGNHYNNSKDNETVKTYIKDAINSYGINKLPDTNKKETRRENALLC